MEKKAILILLGVAALLTVVGALLMNGIGRAVPPTGAASPGDTGGSSGIASSSAPRPSGPSASSSGVGHFSGEPRVIPQMETLSEQLNDPNTPPIEDLYLIEELVAFHISMFQSIPPGGENVDIMRSMTGINPKRVAIVPPGSPALNAQGELVDRWGTPYHFHPVSSSRLEIRSAGPDGQLWTDDDIHQEEIEEGTPAEIEAFADTVSL